MQLTLSIPEFPVTDLLLVVIALLLWRATRLLVECSSQLRSISATLVKSTSESMKMLPAVPAEGYDLAEPSNKSTESDPVTLKQSAALFSKCLLGETDIDVRAFMKGCRHYKEVMSTMGSFTILQIREVEINVKKMEHTYQLAPQKYRSMRELLKAEVDSGMHQPGGVLADPSSAMGLLWARRGLRFWVAYFRPRLDPDNPPEPIAPNEDCLRCFEEALKPYCGWLVTTSMIAASTASPKWEEVAAGMGNEKTPEDLCKTLQTWYTAVVTLLDRMEVIQKEMDLEDQRKTV